MISDVEDDSYQSDFQCPNIKQEPELDDVLIPDDPHHYDDGTLPVKIEENIDETITEEPVTKSLKETDQPTTLKPVSLNIYKLNFHNSINVDVDTEISETSLEMQLLREVFQRCQQSQPTRANYPREEGVEVQETVGTSSVPVVLIKLWQTR